MSDSDISVKLYQSISNANEPRVYEQFHASDIAICPRAHFYKRLGIKPTSIPSGAKMLRWKAGHLIEEVIREHVKNLYPKALFNQRITEGGWTGEYDGYDPESKTLISVKSVGPRAVRYRKKDEDRYHLRDNQPYPAHILQEHAYAHLLKDEPQNILFLYITLEGLIVPYTAKIDLLALAWVRGRVLELNEALEARTPPDCICTEDQPLYKSLYQFCDYKQEDNCCDIKLMEGAEGE